MNSQWWNMPEDKLHSASKYIQNPRQFLEELRK
jgi:hypothetical protein